MNIDFNNLRLEVNVIILFILRLQSSRHLIHLVYESFQIITLHDMGTVQILFVEVSCGSHVDRTDGSILLLYACK